MIFAIIAAWLAYKKATESGRNGILWGFIAVAVFIGTQLLVGLGAGLLIGVGMATQGWADDTFEKSEMVINIVAILASFIATFALLKFLNRPLQNDDSFIQPPPPPNNF